MFPVRFFHLWFSEDRFFYDITVFYGVLSGNFLMNHLLVFAAYLFTLNYFMVSGLMLTNTYHRMLNAN